MLGKSKAISIGLKPSLY